MVNEKLNPYLEQLMRATVPLQVWNHPILQQHDVHVSVRRDDLVHPAIGGNKLYKLLPNLRDALQQGYEGLASFGGHHSNHLYALAAVGSELGIPTWGYVRGHESQPLTLTLERAQQWGMQLRWLDRHTFRDCATNGVSPPDAPSRMWWIPEGGSNDQGVEGCQLWGQRISEEHRHQFDAVMLAMGTGASALGLLHGLDPAWSLYGVPVLPTSWLHQNHWEALQKYGSRFRCVDGYHRDGYAKVWPELKCFLEGALSLPAKIPMEPVYTAKVFYALLGQVQAGAIQQGARILVLHTGGLREPR